MKDHEIAAKVNELRDIAVKFHDHQSLRDRIANVLVDDLKKIQELEKENLKFAMAVGTAVQEIHELRNPATAAIQFAMHDDDGIAFLRLWYQGDFPTLRREWPEAPDAVYKGADPALPTTGEIMNFCLACKGLILAPGKVDQFAREICNCDWPVAYDRRSPNNERDLVSHIQKVLRNPGDYTDQEEKRCRERAAELLERCL